MTHRLFGIGATVAAVTLAAAFVTAQDPAVQGQAGDPPVVQGEAPAQGQMGPGRGLGQGRGSRPGQQLGPGQQRGQRAGRGGQRAGRGRGAGPARRGAGGGLAALDLTDDQRATITGLQSTARDQAAPLQDELTFARKTLHRALFADTRDDAQIANLVDQVAALEQQLADLKVQGATAVADVLTAEQRETMRLTDGRHRGRVAGRGGRGPGRGRGAGR